MKSSDEELRDDRIRLDWLQDQLDKRSYTGKCVFRWSSTNRGMRLHETSEDGAVDDIRQAIDNAMEGKLHEVV